MKSVLLTGATGFIGQHLQQALVSRDFSIQALIRPASIHQANLIDGVTAISAELSDSETLRPALLEADAVIYCAGSVRGRNLADFSAANIDGIKAIVAAMNQMKSTTPLLLVSSLAATRPDISDYARSKYLGEQELVGKAHFPWSILRPPAVYGPGDKEMRPILNLARKGLVTPTGPKGQRVSLIHVDDVASAIVAWLEHWPECKDQIFSLDDGHPGGYSWRDIAEISSGGRHLSVRIPTWILSAAAKVNLASSQLFGYSPMLTPGKARELSQPDWLCDNEALTAATGWSPKIELKQGLLTLFTPAG